MPVCQDCTHRGEGSTPAASLAARDWLVLYPLVIACPVHSGGGLSLRKAVLEACANAQTCTRIWSAGPPLRLACAPHSAPPVLWPDHSCVICTQGRGRMLEAVHRRGLSAQIGAGGLSGFARGRQEEGCPGGGGGGSPYPTMRTAARKRTSGAAGAIRSPEEAKSNFDS